MGYRYIALVKVGQPPSNCSERSSDELFSKLGLRERFTTAAVSLFVSEDTPAVLVPGGGIIVGDLFSNDGSPVRAASELPAFVSYRQIRKDILRDYWGEYVLIQPEAANAMGFTVMRSPSHSGDVPCIYSLQKNTGFITSDVSLAIRLKLYHKSVDWDFVAQRLAYPDLKTSRTGLHAVQEVLPGCTLHVGGSDWATKVEWSPWEYVASGARYSDVNEAAARLREATTCVVRAWAHLDASILLELSGGLDSSIVGVSLQGTQTHIVCSTLLTPVPGADERDYAALVAKQMGLRLHVEEISFENARFEFPIPSHFATPRIGALQQVIDEAMSAAADHHGIASFMSGGGGDTIFSYLRTAAPATDALKERGLRAGITAIRDLAEVHQCTFWKASRLTLSKLMRAPGPAHRADRTFLAPSRMPTDPDSHPWFNAPRDALPGDRERIFDLATTQVYRDSLPRGFDRALRLPLLSQPVMEVCLRTPTWMCIAAGQNRAVARSAFADMLPSEILTRRSKGTFMNYLGSFYQKNRHSMRKFLLTGQLEANNLLDVACLTEFFDDNLKPRDLSFARILDLCAVENWVRNQS